MSQAKNKPGFFTRFTSRVSIALGRPWVFVVAILLIIIWAISGPIHHFSTTWQLIINSGTTIITFLMVFIIQNTQNRDNLAMNIKLDAIIKKLNMTDQDILDAEDLSDKALEAMLKREQNIKK